MQKITNPEGLVIFKIIVSRAERKYTLHCGFLSAVASLEPDDVRWYGEGEA